MTNQTILSDAELIIKGYNSIIVDAQDEYEEIKNEVLLQLEDLDEDFDTYREFELRLEAYENGAFDPDIEKILGIGGRKAGTWNPRSVRARANRAENRAARTAEETALTADDTTRGEKADEQGSNAPEKKKPGLQPIDATQFKGRQPGGEAKGKTRARYEKTRSGEDRTNYKGGDLSDRDTIAGAAARKIIGGRKKLGAAKGKLDQRQLIGEKVGEASGKVKEKVSAGVGAAKAGASAGVGAAKAGAEETGRRGKLAGKIAGTAARSVKDVAVTGQVQPKIRSSGPRSSGPYNRQGPSQPKSTPAGTGTAPSAPKFGEAGFTNWASKSFTDRLRKSMGYRPRHRY